MPHPPLEKVHEALRAMANGMSMTKAIKVFGLTRWTLRHASRGTGAYSVEGLERRRRLESRTPEEIAIARANERCFTESLTGRAPGQDPDDELIRD